MTEIPLKPAIALMVEAENHSFEEVQNVMSRLMMPMKWKVSLTALLERSEMLTEGDEIDFPSKHHFSVNFLMTQVTL
jgi:hypothetical protein